MPRQNNLPQLPNNVQNPEVDNLLNDILGEPQSAVERPSGLFQAQITDDAAPRLSNDTLLKLKKKL